MKKSGIMLKVNEDESCSHHTRLDHYTDYLSEITAELRSLTV